MNFNIKNPAFIFAILIVFIFLIGKIVNLQNFILFKGENFQFYQMISSSFLHASFEHLVSNAIGLLIIGQFTEEEDFLKFSLMWLLFALGSSIFSFIFENAPVLGASGVVLGFLSYFYMKYKNTYDMSGLYIILIMNIGIGFLPGISLWAHIGGAIFGVFYYYFEEYFGSA